MPSRLSAPVLTVVGTLGALAAAPVWAQQIDYETGQYPYPTEQSAAQSDTLVTETRAEGEAPRPAVRVIPMRQAGPAPVFVRGAVVQPLPVPRGAAYVAPAPVAATTATPAIAAIAPRVPAPVYYTYPVAPTGIAMPVAPVAVARYADPAGGAARVIYPAGAPQPLAQAPIAYPQPQTYVTTTVPLPPGAQLVSFDPAAWLAACRERLSTYDPADRDAVMASLGFVATGYAPGGDHCAAYLDSYMASAAAGTLAAPQYYGQQYMLIPAEPVAPPVSER